MTPLLPQPLPPRNSNVIPLRPMADSGISASGRASPFDRLTASLVVAQYRQGVLPEGVLVALLAGAGLRP